MGLVGSGLFGHKDLTYILDKFKYLPLNYVGGKKRFLQWLWCSMEEGNFSNCQTILDPFGGSGIVSYFFRLLDKCVYSNDILLTSHNLLLTLVENPNIILCEDEIIWLTDHSVQGSKLIDQTFSYDDITHFNESNFADIRFSVKEAIFLDCFFHKLKFLQDEFKLSSNEYKYKKAICLSSVFAFANLLPFGAVGASSLMEHRKAQKDKYAERCKGFYLDDEYNLHLYWLANYIRKFSEYVVMAEGCPNGHVFRMDVVDLLNMDFVSNIDLLYLDPPYGGTFSDYLSLYEVTEQLIHQDIKCNYDIHKTDLSNAAVYEDNFRVVLENAQSIPKWVISYNSNAWEDIDYICGVLRDYRSDVNVYLHDNVLQQRGDMVKGKKTEEYLIFVE